MKKTDIIVDGLVATVGANKQAALETLETIRYCHRNGLATTCGLSNISFGLPERSCVNSAFLTMAIASGLTMAIANPSQDILVGAAFASDLLLNKEDSDIRYIEFSGQAKERREEADAKKEALLRQSLQASEGSTVTANQPGNTEVQDGATRQKAAGTKTPQQQAAERVREAVLKGKRKIAEDLTKKALEAGNSPQELLHGQLLPAINEVGELFDKGKYFLPQLIASAETMKLCIGILEPLLLQDQTSEKMPVVVIATVAGDIHDIGKNLVALMLKNYGFQVIDLGKDVPKEKIIEATIEHNAQIIALSALMTTTMQEMRNVVEYAKEKGVTAKIMIGGAVITQDYADEIHADGYSRDAADASGWQSAWSECRSEISAALKNFQQGEDQMEERSRDVISLLEELTEQNRQQTASLKKQLFVTRILAAAGCVLAAAVIAVFLLIVPPMLQIISQGQETLVEATDTLQTAQETLTDIQTLFDENGLVWQSSEALSQATEKLNRMDIESLNSAIRDLGAVVEPLAEFFGKFKR